MYRVYRVQNEETALIAELSGESGTVLTCIDFEGHGEPGYYVVPLEKTLKAEGIELAGKASSIVFVTRTLDWDEEPEGTPAPETPLFS